MKIYPCGTKVKLKMNEELQGMIVTAQIKFKSVIYEIAYDNQGQYSYLWANE